MPEIRLDLLSSRLNVLVIPQVDNVCVDTMIMAHGQAMDICLFAFYVLTVASEDPKVIGILTLLFGMGFKVQEIKKKLKAIVEPKNWVWSITERTGDWADPPPNGNDTHNGSGLLVRFSRRNWDVNDVNPVLAWTRPGTNTIHFWHEIFRCTSPHAKWSRLLDGINPGNMLLGAPVSEYTDCLIFLIIRTMGNMVFNGGNIAETIPDIQLLFWADDDSRYQNAPSYAILAILIYQAARCPWLNFSHSTHTLQLADDPAQSRLRNLFNLFQSDTGEISDLDLMRRFAVRATRGLVTDPPTGEQRDAIILHRQGKCLPFHLDSGDPDSVCEECSTFGGCKNPWPMHDRNGFVWYWEQWSSLEFSV